MTDIQDIADMMDDEPDQFGEWKLEDHMICPFCRSNRVASRDGAIVEYQCWSCGDGWDEPREYVPGQQ